MAAVRDAAALKPQFVGLTHENLFDRRFSVVLQLGAADPDKLAEAARIAEDSGYDEVNINTDHKTPLRITSRGVLFLAVF